MAIDALFRRYFQVSRVYVAVVLFFGALLTPHTTLCADQLSPADYARLPDVSGFRLSPSGEHVALLVNIDGRRGLVTRKLDASEPPAFFPENEYRIQNFNWASEERLIVSVRYSEGLRGKLYNYSRLMSVDRALGDWVELDMSPGRHGAYRQYPRVVSMLPDEPEYILAELDDADHQWARPEVDKVNILTGKKRRVALNRQDIFRWIADADGKLRGGVAYHRRLHNNRVGNEITIYVRETEESDWRIVQQIEVLDQEFLRPIAFDVRDSNILLLSNKVAGDFFGVEEEEVFQFDVKQQKLLGAYLNPVAEAVLAAADGAFPGKRNRLVSKNADESLYFISTSSDLSPPRYYLYDVANERFVYYGSMYPQLEKVEHAAMLEEHYLARDGRRIPAYVTLPGLSEQQRLPLLVYPHGGPWARDHWGFDNYVQFFASRGYAVLQPQFRGSTGFGHAHMAAGFGEWGNAIQDDITDGVNWLIERGVADPDRVCIYGASFGGYAAAMGAASTPDLYRCAIAENGVMDLKAFLDDSGYLLFQDINRAMWNKRSSAEQFSPYHLQDEIVAPILIIASERDTVVPYKPHSRALYRKLKQRRHDVEFLLLEGAEHWRSSEADETAKLEAIEAFLAKHLAPGS